MSNKDAPSMPTAMRSAMRTACDQQYGLQMQRNATQRNATNATTTHLDSSWLRNASRAMQTSENDACVSGDEAMTVAVEAMMDLAVIVRRPDHSAFEAVMRLDRASAARMLLAAACLIDIDETTAQTRARIDAALAERAS